MSPIHVILMTINHSTEDFQETDCPREIRNVDRECNLLSDAILQNLLVRKSSDLNARFSKIEFNAGFSNEEIIQKLQADVIPDSSTEVFFVFVCKRFGKISTRIYEVMREFCADNHLKVYGMHFQGITPISWRALSLHISSQLSRPTCHTENFKDSTFPVTGILDETSCCIEKYPVILYLIHLSIGENGLRRLKKVESKERGIPLVLLIFSEAFTMNLIFLTCLV